MLQKNFGIVHNQLKKYEENWWEMPGLLARLKPRHDANTLADGNGKQDDNKGKGKNIGLDDLEFIIGPALTMWGNYLLPVIFGLLGILVFVILDFYGKIRDSRLDPRDHWLCLIRLVLGLVTGSCRMCCN